MRGVKVQKLGISCESFRVQEGYGCPHSGYVQKTRHVPRVWQKIIDDVFRARGIRRDFTFPENIRRICSYLYFINLSAFYFRCHVENY